MNGQQQGGLSYAYCMYNVTAGHVAGTYNVWAHLTDEPPLNRKRDDCMTVTFVDINGTTRLRTAQTSITGNVPASQLCLPDSYTEMPTQSDSTVTIVTYNVYTVSGVSGLVRHDVAVR